MNLQNPLLQFLFSYKGRIGRLPYNLGIFICFLGGQLPSYLPPLMPENLYLHIVPYITYLFVSYIWGCLIVKRFHDLNKSGWYALLFIIPFVNVFFALKLMLQKAPDEHNNFTQKNEKLDELVNSQKFIMNMSGAIAIIIVISLGMSIAIKNKGKRDTLNVIKKVTTKNSSPFKDLNKRSKEEERKKAANKSKNLYAEAYSLFQEKIYSTSFDIFTQLDKQGDYRSSYMLGLFHYQGLLSEKNYPLAFEFFKKAADQGFAQSQYMLGLMYYYGLGINKDTTQATHWLEKASAQGFAQADQLKTKIQNSK